MEKTASAGKNTFVGISGGSTGIVLLLYTVHKFGIDDMTPEVAAAIITFAGGIAAGIQHWLEEVAIKREKKDAENNRGVTGSPDPVA